MPFIYICQSCGRLHSYEEFSKSKFCRKCGTFLFKRLIQPSKEAAPESRSIIEKNKEHIAKHIIDWYQNWLKSNADLEEELPREIDAESPEGKFEVVILATLFSEYIMREERAYRLWLKIKSWFRAKGYDYLKIFTGENVQGLSELKKEVQDIGALSRLLEQMQITSKNLLRHGGDLNNLLVKNNWIETIRRIQNNCYRVRQKAFWITRIMNQKEVWNVPGEYCCVSDSHVKALLKKTGFISSTEDLFYNSRIIWRYFNQPFNEKYYDLGIFRFAQEHRCKKCRLTRCDLESLEKCR